MFAYESEAVTVDSRGPFSETARSAGWTVVSMQNEWATIFPAGVI